MRLGCPGVGREWEKVVVVEVWEGRASAAGFFASAAQIASKACERPTMPELLVSAWQRNPSI